MLVRCLPYSSWDVPPLRPILSRPISRSDMRFRKYILAITLVALIAITSPFIVKYFIAHIYLQTENRNFEKIRKKSILHNDTMPLHCAIRDQNSAEVNKLLVDGVNLELKDSWGRTALFWSVRYSSFEYIDLLLENGADPNTKNEKGESVFYHAVTLGKFDIASKLLKYGADINILNRWGEKDTMTALHYCVHHNKTKGVQYLLENGVDKNTKNSRGFTVLDWLEDSDHINDEIKFLLRKEHD